MALENKVFVIIIPFVDDGGVERLVANMSNYLDDKGNDVFVYSISSGNSLGKVFFKKNFFISFNQLLYLIIKNRKQIILFSALTPANLFATFLCILFGLKFYPTHNCVIFKKNIIKWFFIKLIYNFINIFSYKFIATSSGTEDNLNTILINSKKVVNYYNPVLEILYKPVSSKRLEAGVIKFCMLGRLSHQKGFDIIIEAFAKINNRNIYNFELYIGGNGEELIFLKNLAIKYNLTNKIHFVGFVSNLNEFYEGKDYFLFPSRYEGLGLALIEAMNYGLPVISSNCLSGPSEILFNGDIGILIEHFENPDEWANEILKVLTSLPKNISINYELSLKRFLISEYLNKLVI